MEQAEKLGPPPLPFFFASPSALFLFSLSPPSLVLSLLSHSFLLLLFHLSLLSPSSLSPFSSTSLSLSLSLSHSPLSLLPRSISLSLSFSSRLSSSFPCVRETPQKCSARQLDWVGSAFNGNNSALISTVSSSGGVELTTCNYTGG